MRFSVLLPTRNGGNFLDNCIRSILEQDYGDFELVISDNANTDATPGIIRGFSGDPRLKVIRQTTPISVSENWTAVLHASSGDYVLMMGDDDYMLPRYFERMEKILERNNYPDCVVYNAYSYVAPDSISSNPQSFYSDSHFRFGPDMKVERLIDKDQRFRIVCDMFHFKVRIPLNMQTSLVGRKAAEKIRGGLFQAPFPDHYALNSLLLTADSWVFSPEKLLVVGVSSKSFGHYVYSNQQGDGLTYLGIADDFDGCLQGNVLLNGMHIWLNLLKQNYSELLQGVEVDRAIYVRRQVYSWCVQLRLGTITVRDFVHNFSLISYLDWGRLLASIVDKESWGRLWHILASRNKSDAETQWRGLQPLDKVADIRQFAQWLTLGGAAEP
ncbi:MAG: glycosyltransferase family 2 protein [Nitrospirae bacterium]|jgi:glycosyltransferase involved in cell wall biosynthesis|nr:glycosyltransferase family 2 protein [Nitrospirota bacterium]